MDPAGDKLSLAVTGDGLGEHSPDCDYKSDDMPPDQIDLEMRELSGSMGRRMYRRDHVELLLCESLPGRGLKKQDVFVYGQAIFNLSYDGIAMIKKFGNNQCWLPIKTKLRKYKFFG